MKSINAMGGAKPAGGPERTGATARKQDDGTGFDLALVLAMSDSQAEISPPRKADEERGPDSGGTGDAPRGDGSKTADAKDAHDPATPPGGSTPAAAGAKQDAPGDARAARAPAGSISIGEMLAILARQGTRTTAGQADAARIAGEAGRPAEAGAAVPAAQDGASAQDGQHAAGSSGRAAAIAAALAAVEAERDQADAGPERSPSVSITGIVPGGPLPGMKTASSTAPAPAQPGPATQTAQASFDAPTATAGPPGGRVTVPFADANGLEGQLRVAVRGQVVHATIVSSDSEMVRRLGSDMGELQRALAGRGFPDAHVSVQQSRHADTAQFRSRQDADPRSQEDEREGRQAARRDEGEGSREDRSQREPRRSGTER